MRNRFDQLAKRIMKTLLRTVAQVDVGREVPGFALVADLWVEPDSAAAPELAQRGVLGRMLAMGPCLVEPFSRAPGVRDVRPCILKQYAVDNEQEREQERDGKGESPFPGLWIIAAGRPERLVDMMGLQPMAGWPAGFWESPRIEFDAFRLVIVPMLPETPETLFLRFLGRGGTLKQALRELAARDAADGDGAWEVRVLRPVLIAFRGEFAQYRDDFPDEMTEDDMDALQELETIYTTWERKVHDEGHEGGVKEGLVVALEALCAVLDIELTDERRKEMAGWDVARLERAVDAIKTSRRWPEA
jgi:hypothetical protein